MTCLSTCLCMSTQRGKQGSRIRHWQPSNDAQASISASWHQSHQVKASFLLFWDQIYGQFASEPRRLVVHVFQLRQLRAIRSSLTTDAAKMLAQAFVGGRLDYCNSLLYGVSEDLLRRLQSVQNAAARFITGARKYDHISPVLRDLHWLPLRQRIIFKIATLMHQCFNGLAPTYLATDCISISSMSGRRQLRSATSGQLYIPRTKTMTFGPRSFKVSGPTIWNDLTARLKDSSMSKNFQKIA